MGKLVLLLVIVAAIGVALIALFGTSPPPSGPAAEDRSDAGSSTSSAAARAGTVQRDSPGEGARIRGRVLRPDGLAGRDAVVTLHPPPDGSVLLPEATAEVAPDADGAFELAEVPVGPWVVRASQGEFAPVAVLVEGLVERETRDVLLRLGPGRRLTGRVVAPNGDTVAHARVRISPGAMQVGPAAKQFSGFVFPSSSSTAGGTDGTFAFRGLAEGFYDVEASAEGYLPGRALGLRPTVEDVLVVLHDAFEISVRVEFDGEEAPSPDVRTQADVHADRVGAEAGALLFRLEGLPAGEHRIEGVAPGFATARASAVVGPGVNPGPVVLRLLPGTVVTGRVTEEFTGEAVPGVSIAFLEVLEGVSDREPEERIRAGTDEDGRYETVLGPGFWIARTERDGYGPAIPPRRRFWESPEISFRVGIERLEHDLSIRKDRAAVGRVLFRNGEPAGERAVAFVYGSRPAPGAPRPVGLPRPPRVGTDREGRFRLVGLVPSVVYTIRASAGEGFDEVVNVTLPEGEDVVEVRDLVVDEPPGGGPEPPPTTVRGRILHHGGAAIAGARVVTRIGSASTDLDGRFEIEGPFARGGWSSLRVLAPNRPPAWGALFQCSGDVVDVGDVVLPAFGVLVSGRVTDPKGRPIPAAEVRLSLGDSSVTVRTDRAGAFELEGPSPSPRGSVRVVAEARAPGFVTTRRTARVVDHQELDLVLERPSVVKGKLVFPGEPPAWVDLVLGRSGRGTGPRVPVRFGADGSFVVELSGYQQIDAVEAANLLTVEFRNRHASPRRVCDLGKIVLHTGGALIVRCVDSLGRRVEQAEEVRLSRRSGPLSRRRPEPIEPRRLGRDGTARFEFLPPGSYRVVVRPDWRPGSATVEIKGDETREIEVRIP